MEAEIPNLPMTFDKSFQNGQRVQFQDRAMARFYMFPEQRKAASQEAGRPIYESVPYISIIQPGEKDTRDRRVRPDDKQRFPQQWAAFEAKQQQKIDGTPLSVLFPHNPGAVKTLEFLHVVTIEQLAALGTGQLQNLGLGASQWQVMAQGYLDSAEKGKDYHEFQSKLDAKDNEIAKLSDLVSKLEQRVNELDSDKPKRGRRGAQEET
jgi:hypothetical protein